MQKEIVFEESKIKTQIALEDAFMSLAKASGNISPSSISLDAAITRMQPA